MAASPPNSPSPPKDHQLVWPNPEDGRMNMVCVVPVYKLIDFDYPENRIHKLAFPALEQWHQDRSQRTKTKLAEVNIWDLLRATKIGERDEFKHTEGRFTLAPRFLDEELKTLRLCFDRFYTAPGITLHAFLSHAFAALLPLEDLIIQKLFEKYKTHLQDIEYANSAELVDLRGIYPLFENGRADLLDIIEQIEKWCVKKKLPNHELIEKVTKIWATHLPALSYKPLFMSQRLEDHPQVKKIPLKVNRNEDKAKKNIAFIADLFGIDGIDLSRPIGDIHKQALHQFYSDRKPNELFFEYQERLDQESKELFLKKKNRREIINLSELPCGHYLAQKTGLSFILNQCLVGVRSEFIDPEAMSLATDRSHNTMKMIVDTSPERSPHYKQMQAEAARVLNPESKLQTLSTYLERYEKENTPVPCYHIIDHLRSIEKGVDLRAILNILRDAKGKVPPQELEKLVSFALNIGELQLNIKQIRDLKSPQKIKDFMLEAASILDPAPPEELSVPAAGAAPESSLQPAAASSFPSPAVSPPPLERSVPSPSLQESSEEEEAAPSSLPAAAGAAPAEEAGRYTFTLSETPKNFTASEAEDALTAAGFVSLGYQRGSHRGFRHKSFPELTTIVAYHGGRKPIASGTLHSIFNTIREAEVRTAYFEKTGSKQMPEAVFGRLLGAKRGRPIQF